MSYWLIALGVTGVGIGLFIILYRNRIRHLSAARVTAHRQGGEYHSVEINCNRGACLAARAMQGQRFLATEAPLLQLAGCDASTCQCRYRHFNDRRIDERRNPYGRYGCALQVYAGEDRRRQAGRRASDVVDHKVPVYGDTGIGGLARGF